MKKYILPSILLLFLISFAFAVEGVIPIGPAPGHSLIEPLTKITDFAPFLPTDAEIAAFDPKLVPTLGGHDPNEKAYWTRIMTDPVNPKMTAWYLMRISVHTQSAWDPVALRYDTTYAGAIEGAKTDLQVNSLPDTLKNKGIPIALNGADEAYLLHYRQVTNRDLIFARRNNFIVFINGEELNKKSLPTRFAVKFAELILKNIYENGY